MKERSEKSFTVRLTKNTWRDLRKVSFLEEIAMQQIVQQGINIMLDKYKKVLTNSDVVVS